MKHLFLDNSRPRYFAQRGAAYVVALLVTTVLAGFVLVFAREMRVSTDQSANQVSQIQAQWIAQGALEAVRGDLASVIALGQAPRLDQVDAQAQQLGDGLFWLIRPDHTDDSEIAFGIQGEGGKINLGALITPVGNGGALPDFDLLELPGMDENLAAAIIDWQDPDENVSPGGAEAAYYLSRETPYEIKNGGLETVGEMRYIRDVTQALLYGEDANRNGKLDPNEDDGSANTPDDNADGQLDRGFIDHFTIYSNDPGLSDSGEEKITLDVVTSAQERNALSAFLATHVGEERAAELAARSFARTGSNSSYVSVLEFMTVTEATEEEFELVHDGLKRLDNDENIEGLIDVYHASEDVFATLPGLDPGDARALINARPDLENDEPVRNISWIIDVLGEEKAIEAARYMTHRSLQFTVDIVALSGDGRSFCRLRAVLDCTPVLEGDTTLPRILYVQDVTALGWPLDESIRETLRGDATPEEVAAIYSEASN